MTAVDATRELGYVAAIVALLALLVLRYLPRRAE
jgi:hypothetical protein